jgi:hypothetical protein
VLSAFADSHFLYMHSVDWMPTYVKILKKADEVSALLDKKVRGCWAVSRSR